MDPHVENVVAHATRRPANASPQAEPERRTWSTPGFGPLTPIDTDWGQFPAQALRLRDRVRLRSGAFRAITFVDHLLLDEAFLDRNEDAQPVLVQPGRLGYGMPTQPILLAPGQKLALGQGADCTFHTAHDLLRAGIGLRHPERFLTYVLFGFDEPEDIRAAGLWLRVEPRSTPENEEDDFDI